LKGASATDLPVEQPTTFEVIINREIAKALSLAIPRTLVLRVDRVIKQRSPRSGTLGCLVNDRFWPIWDSAVSDRGCVKTQNGTCSQNIGLPKRAVFDYFWLGIGRKTPEFEIALSFYTASARSGRSKRSSDAALIVTGRSFSHVEKDRGNSTSSSLPHDLRRPVWNGSLV